MSTFKYYIDNKEFTPINTGDFTLDISLVQDSGAYQYIKEINGTVNYDKKAYEYILLNDPCQKILFTIIEFCGLGEFVAFNGYFTLRDSTDNPDKKLIEIKPKENTLYDCLTKNYDTDFNILEASNVVDSSYEEDYGRYEYRVKEFGTGAIAPIIPFFPPNVECSGISPFFLFGVFVRETKTVNCNGGEPQPPEGTGWELLQNECDTKNLCTWYRLPPQFVDSLTGSCVINFTDTTCAIPNCSPPVPAIAGNWFLMDTFDLGAGGTIGFWIDLDSIPKTTITFDNGRDLLDVINLGLNVDCAELDIQSEFFTSDTNPITGINPSPTKNIQLHAISDIKNPTATEPATIETTTIKNLLESLVANKFNNFWRVDENTQRLILENYKDLNNIGVFDITQYPLYTALKNQYSYDNSDIPRSESFPSEDVSIDFTGVDILYKNECATGNKAYANTGFFAEIDSIYSNPDEYSNDGIVFITPDSMNVDGTNAQEGAITGEYLANVPNGMANLQQDYWIYNRPFNAGIMNFKNTNFFAKPDKDLEEIKIPLCCLFFFQPYARFIGNNFNRGQLQSASFNFQTGFITLNIKYYE